MSLLDTYPKIKELTHWTPNPNPNSNLPTRPHLVSLVLDLPKTYLWIKKAQAYSGKLKCCYINDQIETNALHRFSDKIGDTVFIGYIFNNKYIIEDLIIYNGDYCPYILPERLTLINKIINHEYIPDPILETYTIAIMDYVEYSFLYSYYEHIKTLPYNHLVTSLIFKGLDSYIFDRNAYIQITSTESTKSTKNTESTKSTESTENLKHNIIKNPSRFKCVFKIKKTQKPDIYELYLKDTHGHLAYYDIACIPDRNSSKYVKNLLKSKPENNVVCEFNKDFQSWTPVNITRDQPHKITYIMSSQ